MTDCALHISYRCNVIHHKIYVEHLFVPVMNHILININHIFTDKFLVKEFNSFP